MADVITRFKLETTQYDSKLRDEAKRLAEFTRQCSMAGNEFGKFSQKNVEAARALGSFTPSATNAKDKVKELVGAFNDAAKAYNALTKEQQQSDFGKAMAESLGQLNVKIREAKQELYGMGEAMKKAGGGGLFSGLGDKMGGAIQVFAGNMMTKAAGAVANLGSEMYGMVQQGIELAKQGEGIRIAFERLGRGDILDGLRQATHGTVTDLELMKAAVKFNDFKLPVEELGTMLAFAQQKAKDTGQSVDYMVDSIVTGLGRKSLMILDNLGLSATEVKEKMAETGDMTKAVGAIIREQMAKAGDYVETAADRAAQANVSLQNKMEELGRKFAPLEEASNSLWTSMKINILDLVGGPLTGLLNKLTAVGRMANAYGLLGGSTKVGKMVSNLSNAKEGNRQALYQIQQEKFWRYINPREQMIKDIRAWQRGERGDALSSRVGAITEKYGMLDATKIQAEVDAAKKMLADYQQAAKQILQPIKQYVSPPPSGGGGKGGKAEIEAAIGSIDYQTQKVQELQKAWRAAADDDSRQKIKAEIEEQQYLLDRMTGKEKFDPTKIGPIADLTGRVPVPDFGVDMKRGKNGKWYDATAPVAPDEIKFSDSLQKFMDYMEKQQVDDYKKRQSHDGWDDTKKVVSGLNQVAGGLQQMGIKLPEEVQQIIGVINGLMTVIDGVNTIIGVTQSANLTANTIALGALTQALWTNTAFSFFPGMAHGGVVRAAVGYEVPGNHFSGDMVPALLNSGETVLNRAQSGIIASALEGVSGSGGGTVRTVLSGEQCYLMIDRYARRTGKGEMMFWR